jgi:hypothetical protein
LLTATRPVSAGGTTCSARTTRCAVQVLHGCAADVVQYHAYKDRVAAAKPKDRAAVEKRELEEVEKEGIRAERLAELGGGRGGMEGVKRGKLE